LRRRHEFIDRLTCGIADGAHSRGGGLALLAAAERPERVRGVVAYEPTVPQTASLQSRLPELVQRTLNRRANFADRQEMYAHFRNRGAFKDWQDDFVRAYVQHGASETEDGRVELANPPEVEALMAETMLDGTEWVRIDACQLPVLAVYGESNLVSGGQRPGCPRGCFPNTTIRIQVDPHLRHNTSGRPRPRCGRSRRASKP
jgi:pimeloyl-ACP methyl ester carboxylesterase